MLIELCLSIFLNFNTCIHSLNFLHVSHEADQAPNYLVKYVLYTLDYTGIEETLSCISVGLTFD